MNTGSASLRLRQHPLDHRAHEPLIPVHGIHEVPGEAPPIDVVEVRGGAIHIVGLIEKMLALQERLAPIRNVASTQRDDLLRQVAQVDSAIDEAVYDLYGLTKAERRIIEEG